MRNQSKKVDKTLNICSWKTFFIYSIYLVELETNLLFILFSNLNYFLLVLFEIQKEVCKLINY